MSDIPKTDAAEQEYGLITGDEDGNFGLVQKHRMAALELQYNALIEKLEELQIVWSSYAVGDRLGEIIAEAKKKP